MCIYLTEFTSKLAHQLTEVTCQHLLVESEGKQNYQLREATGEPYCLHA